MPSSWPKWGEGSDQHREMVEWFRSLPLVLDLGGLRAVHASWEPESVALVPSGQEDSVPDIAIPEELMLRPVEGAPVFIGHHWFAGQPVIESPKLACLDWSAAKDGLPVGYRWAGESELSNENLVWVE